MTLISETWAWALNNLPNNILTIYQYVYVHIIKFIKLFFDFKEFGFQPFALASVFFQKIISIAFAENANFSSAFLKKWKTAECENSV